MKYAFALIAALAVSAQTRRWTIDDILAVPRLESPRISPDGTWVLYTMSGAVAAENRRTSDLFAASADGARTVRLTTDGAAKTSPRWSPDSKRVGFIADRQVWAAPVAGGKPERLTSSPRGVVSFAWPPRGSQIAYIAAEPDSAGKIAHQKEWGAVISPEEMWPDQGAVWIGDRTVFSGEMPASLQWAPDGRRIAFLSGQKLYSGDTSVAEDVYSFTWSPQGTSIAYVAARPDPQPYLNLFKRPVFLGKSTIWVLDTETWRARRVSREEYAGLAEVHWSRDGTRLAFTATPPGSHPTMYVVRVSDGTAVHAAPGLDLLRGALNMTWSAGDREIWFVNGERMGYNVFAASAATGAVRRVTTGQDCVTEVTYSADFSAAAFVRENANTKPDIYITRLPEWRPKKITDLAPEVRDFALGRSEIIRYPSEGREIEALLVTPPGFDAKKKYPLILIVHGGPTWYKKNEWRLEWEQHPIQAYAAEGYCLLFPNVRGSADYGFEFRRANYGDLGGGDARDALAGVDHLIARGFIDPEKLGVAGWSYGGFLTPALITQTDRFKAAQFGAGIPSFEAMYSQLSTVEWIIHENYGARPWEDPDTHIRESPLYAARKVKTPTLIQHGENDPRCPVSGSILFYKALKFYGVPAVLEIYPKEGHGIMGPLLRRRCLRRNLEWFNKWLKGDRATSFEKLFR